MISLWKSIAFYFYVALYVLYNFAPNIKLYTCTFFLATNSFQCLSNLACEIYSYSGGVASQRVNEGYV